MPAIVLRAGERAATCVLLQLLPHPDSCCCGTSLLAAARVGDVSTTKPIGVASLYGKAGLIAPLCW